MSNPGMSDFARMSFDQMRSHMHGSEGHFPENQRDFSLGLLSFENSGRGLSNNTSFLALTGREALGLLAAQSTPGGVALLGRVPSSSSGRRWRSRPASVPSTARRMQRLHSTGGLPYNVADYLLPEGQGMDLQELLGMYGTDTLRTARSGRSRPDEDFSYEELLALDDTVERRGLSARARMRLKAVPARPQDQGKECSICQENMVSGECVTPLVCSHVFHKNCVMKW
eukprot:CAMPEP_0113937288 /NCGR_PEP_ID=MMETSP1339-20121228/3943_1 /TAXON_ID=94617 /ORGANISM="Fibrocapsa japonica" /LENGTH=226 /DNA_ID=CAMNT_0000939995 /DNA_START=33 /DNA_END=710 /DNA_ORIENTATION=- /assembly_acc=CAM_ASM_000762